MPEHLTDFIITKVFEGPSGEGEYGLWQVYNFYTDKTEKKKFSWFGGDKKILPVDGMEVDYMEFDEEQKGKYTNYTVKKLALKEKNKSAENSSQTTSQPQPINGQVSYYVSYVKDIAVAILSNGGNLETADLNSIAQRIGKAGLIMMNECLVSVQNTPSESHNTPQDANKPKAEGNALSPENEKLKKRLQGYAKKNKEIYFKVLGKHGAEKGEDIYGFAFDAQTSLLNDLEKELGEIPF